MENYNHFPKVISELRKLDNSVVAVGFLAGVADYKLLTIVRANDYVAHIVPKNGKWLTIPSKECPLGTDGLPMHARNVKGLFRPKGKNILCVNRGGELVVYYYLVKHVTIPARPFIRTAFIENETKYSKIVQNGVTRILNSTGTALELLNQLGEICSSDIRVSSIKWAKPPNAPVTIARKGADNPLVDRGILQKKVTYQVFLHKGEA